jgi:hypothetical protein
LGRGFESHPPYRCSSEATSGPGPGQGRLGYADILKADRRRHLTHRLVRAAANRVAATREGPPATGPVRQRTPRPHAGRGGGALTGGGRLGTRGAVVGALAGGGAVGWRVGRGGRCLGGWRDVGCGRAAVAGAMTSGATTGCPGGGGRCPGGWRGRRLGAGRGCPGGGGRCLGGWRGRRLGAGRGGRGHHERRHRRLCAGPRSPSDRARRGRAPR